MPPIGETLREARMRQQLDIADVEARTKIRAKYLRALEHEEWHALPGPTYVRTFLRTYAELLGIDGHLLVDEYRARNASEETDFAPLAGPPAAARRDPRARRGGRVPGPPGPGVAVAVLVVAVVGLLLVLGLVADPEDEKPSSDRSRAATQTEQRKAAPRRRKRPAAVREATVRIAPEAPTYACLDTGAGTDIVYEGTLEEPRTFRNSRRLRINLGKRAVAVRANGRAVEIEDTPEPLGLTVTRRGAREITSGTRPCG